MSQNLSLERRRSAAVAAGVAGKSVYVARALNSEVWDVDGRRYIDLTAGIAVNNTGHRHPVVMAAVAKQAEAFTHTCFNVGPFEGYIRLCEQLNDFVDTGEINRSICFTTGAEAVENAVKIARAATGRRGVIAFTGAFHGRTAMGLALTGKVAPYKQQFGPLPGEVFHCQFPDSYAGISTADALRSLESIFAADISPKEVAAIIIEPVQGEGGFNVSPPDFLRALRTLADRHGILLIADEIQGGMARTGKMLSIEHSGVKPDLVTLAKGLGGGFPLSAVVGKARIMDAAPNGGLGGTYAGNPLAVSAANAVLEVIRAERLCERAEMIGEIIRKRLTSFASALWGSAIGDVRGLGAMVAFELVSNRATKNPYPVLADRIVAEAEARGLLVLACGTRANVIRLLPPLTISDEILSESLDLLEASVSTALTAPASAS